MIKEIVKDKYVEFKYFRAGNLFYETECGMLFPVPIEDTGEATFKDKDKAIFFMRYIRKHLKTLEDKDE